MKVDDGPGVGDLHVDPLLVGNGLGAVIDEKNEGKRQQAKADEAQQEFDHAGAGEDGKASQRDDYSPARACSMRLTDRLSGGWRFRYSSLARPRQFSVRQFSVSRD